MSAAPVISVIIPVLHEEAVINRCIDSVRASAGGFERYEIIVVDGDRSGGTLAAIDRTDIGMIAAPRGRAAQMNAGARAAGGRVLLFLHADTGLPPGWPAAVSPRWRAERPLPAPSTW